jgi:hypothetical protein
VTPRPGTTAELPAGRSVASAAFSPDGGFLAVEVSFSNEAEDGGQAVQLELLSMATGRLTAVPGTPAAQPRRPGHRAVRPVARPARSLSG